MRTGNFDVVVEANCNGVVNPVMDTQKYLPKKAFVENYGGYDDPYTDRDLRQDGARERYRRSSAPTNAGL